MGTRVPPWSWYGSSFAALHGRGEGEEKRGAWACVGGARRGSSCICLPCFTFSHAQSPSFGPQVLPDLNLDSAVALLEFMYTDNLAQPLGPLSPGLSRLVIAAEKYDVPKLAALCRFVASICLCCRCLGLLSTARGRRKFAVRSRLWNLHRVVEYGTRP